MPLAPEYEAMLAQAEEAGGPSLSDLSPADGRAMYQMMRPANPAIEVGSVRDETITGPEGDDLTLRIYTPAGAGPHPVLMNFHGGGWVIGDLETSDAISRNLCAGADCIVISVDYRLAPEHRYPAAADDCILATAWVAANREALNATDALAVTGESAGGNLAAIVANNAATAGGPKICFQLLAYPVVDHDFSYPSYTENGEGYLLTVESMQYFWDHYCPDIAQRMQANASPLRAASFEGVAPALVMTAEFDPLRDEGAAYADALKAAGVAVDYRCYDGLVHDFLATAGLFECTRQPFGDACAALKQAFGRA